MSILIERDTHIADLFHGISFLFLRNQWLYSLQRGITMRMDYQEFAQNSMCSLPATMYPARCHTPLRDFAGQALLTKRKPSFPIHDGKDGRRVYLFLLGTSSYPVFARMFYWTGLKKFRATPCEYHCNSISFHSSWKPLLWFPWMISHRSKFFFHRSCSICIKITITGVH